VRTLAGLFEAVEAETPYGGHSVTYEPIGQAWLTLGARRRRESGEAGQRVGVETVEAVAWVDGRLSEGRVLRFGGADWVIGGIDEAGAGRVRLSLERTR